MFHSKQPPEVLDFEMNRKTIPNSVAYFHASNLVNFLGIDVEVSTTLKEKGFDGRGRLELYPDFNYGNSDNKKSIGHLSICTQRNKTPEEVQELVKREIIGFGGLHIYGKPDVYEIQRSIFLSKDSPEIKPYWDLYVEKNYSHLDDESKSIIFYATIASKINPVEIKLESIYQNAVITLAKSYDLVSKYKDNQIAIADVERLNLNDIRALIIFGGQQMGADRITSASLKIASDSHAIFYSSMMSYGSHDKVENFVSSLNSNKQSEDPANINILDDELKSSDVISPNSFKAERASIPTVNNYPYELKPLTEPEAPKPSATNQHQDFESEIEKLRFASKVHNHCKNELIINTETNDEVVEVVASARAIIEKYITSPNAALANMLDGLEQAMCVLDHRASGLSNIKSSSPRIKLRTSAATKFLIGFVKILNSELYGDSYGYARRDWSQSARAKNILVALDSHLIHIEQTTAEQFNQSKFLQSPFTLKGPSPYD